VIDGGAGGDIDDCARGLFQHHRQGGVEEEIAGPEIGVQHAVKLSNVRLPEPGASSPGAHGVDEDVNAPMFGGNLLDEVPRCAGLDEVHRPAAQINGRVPGEPDQCVHFSLAAIGNDNSGAFSKERKGDRAAQAAGAAGDEYDLL